MHLCVCTSAPSLTRFQEFRPVPLRIQKAAFDRDCTARQLEVLDSVYSAADDKQVTVLVGFDLSAAFDTVSHETLLQRLQAEFGVTGTALLWLRSYLSGRLQLVKLGNHQSPAVSLNVGVPQV